LSFYGCQIEAVVLHAGMIAHRQKTQRGKQQKRQEYAN
jgi:hypothetical protein